MARYYSEEYGENQSTNNQYEVCFEHEGRGTETIEIDNELLNTFDSCKERAEAEFLSQAYIHKIITFDTYHVSDVQINDDISVENNIYKVISVSYNIVGAKASMRVTAKRWD